jgi:hypothetical protein
MLLTALLCGPCSDGPIQHTPHVRPASPAAHALLTEAVAKSALLNTLIERIEASDVFIYVEITNSPDVLLARTRLVAAAPGARFLRVTLNAQAAPWERLPLLGHELQHAVEIASDAGVRDDDGIRRLYRRVGFAGGIDKYETEAARDVERRIRLELARATPHP